MSTSPSDGESEVFAGDATMADAAATPVRCGAVTLIAIRGTGAPGGTKNRSDGFVYDSSETGAPKSSDGYGAVGNPETALVAGIRKKVPYPVYTEGLFYPASAFQTNNKNAVYWNSVNIGVTNLIGELNRLSGACGHDTRIWLAGHSQGAQIIGMVLALHASSIRNINMAGVVLVGDPTYTEGYPEDAGGNGPNDGLFESRIDYIAMSAHRGTDTLGYSVLDVRSYCKPYDFFCQAYPFDFGFKIHSSYGDPTTVGKEVSFLENF